MASAATVSSSTESAGSQRVPLLRSDSGHSYPKWRPQMETFMIRARIQEGDYKEPTE